MIKAIETQSGVILKWVERALATGLDWPKWEWVLNPKEADYHRSAMQKCIRRGLTEYAIYHFESFCAYDDNKAWMALSVTAGEDVGLGEPTVVALTLLCTLSTFRKKFNTKLLGRGIIILLCNASKNRMGCQINVLADCLIEKGSMVGIVDDPGKLLEAVRINLQFNTMPIITFEMLRRLRKLCRNGNIELLTECLQMLHDLSHTNTAGLVASILFERMTDDLHFGVIVTLMRAIRDPDASMDVHTTGPLQSDMMSGHMMPMATLDRHTSIGRMALTRWAKTPTADVFKEAGVEFSNVYKAMGAVMFFEEAALVSNSLILEFYGSAKLVQDQTLTWVAMKAGLDSISQETYDTWVNACLNDVSTLNQIRTLLWKKE